MQGDTLKAKRNQASQEIGALKAKAKADPAAAAEAEKRMVETRAVGDEIKAIDQKLAEVDAEFTDFSLRLPNIPHASVPNGSGAEDNVEARRWGTPRKFSFQPLDHVTLGEKLGILDFEVPLSSAR
jgi:seryl-tRNA synthetase